jgi:hypothetical protein
MPVLAGPKLKLSELIARAARQGCIVRFSTLRLVTPDGLIPIRYLFNSANRGRFDITDYDDDEYMLVSEIEAAERRLGITLIYDD